MAEKKTVKKTSIKKPVVKAEKSTIVEPIINQKPPEAVHGGTGMQSKVVPMLVAMVVISAFAVGLLYGKVSVYEKGGAGTAGTPSGTANAGEAAEVAPEAPVNLDEAMWAEVLKNPVAEMGESDAKVTMVEFTDYQCPFCARYFSDTMSQIKQNFVDTGKIRYVLRDLPLSFHPNAKPAALAARCAGDQEKYMEMHDALYTSQDSWANLSDPKENFVKLATDLGLNVGTFTSCYDDGKYNDEIDADLALANKVGASGTPTFYINGKQVVGAQPYSAFQTELDAALAE